MDDETVESDDGAPTDADPSDVSVDTAERDVGEPDVASPPTPDATDVEVDTATADATPSDVAACERRDAVDGCDSCKESFEPMEISCDDEDNDCDGNVDESFLKATSVGAGVDHTCACTSEAETVCWGDAANGKLGEIEGAHSATPHGITVGGTPHPCRLVATGVEHTCTAGAEGVHCWGSNKKHQLTAYDIGDSSSSPVSIEFESREQPDSPIGQAATELEAGFNFNCLLVDSDIYCWGSNEDNQLTTECNEEFCDPVEPQIGSDPTFDPDFTELAVGGAHTCGLTENGTVYCWGRDTFGQIGDGQDSETTQPTGTAIAFGDDGKDITTIAAGTDHTCAIDADQRLFCWGLNASKQVGPTPTTPAPIRYETPQEVQIQNNFEHIEAGDAHTFGIDANANVYGWGANNQGRLGAGASEKTVGTPVEVDLDREVDILAAGSGHNCAVLGEDGRVRCWGNNESGKLGNSTSGGSVGAAGADDAAVACMR